MITRSVWKKLRADCKGAAMEMAIMLLVVAFALSTLVLTVSLLQRTAQTKAEREIQRSVALEQIGQNFCTAVAEGKPHSWTTAYPDYTITINGLTLTAADSESGETYLTVTLQEQDGKYTITQWNKR